MSEWCTSTTDMVVPYDEQWSALFARESVVVSACVGANIASIHHVGSTSVAGLSSRPVIHLLLLVPDIDAVALRSQRALHSAGYGQQQAQQVQQPFHLAFTKTEAREDKVIRFTLHILPEGYHGAIDRMILLRDHLRSNDTDRLHYDRLLRNKRDSEILQFIEDVLENHVSYGDVLELVRCSDDAEWEHYHRIRYEELFSPAGLAYCGRDHFSLTRQEYEHYVMRRGVRAVGVLLTERMSPEVSVIRNLAITRREQGAGLGARLLALADRLLYTQGVRRVYLHALVGQSGFYTRAGYKVITDFNEPEHKRLLHSERAKSEADFCKHLHEETLAPFDEICRITAK